MSNNNMNHGRAREEVIKRIRELVNGKTVNSKDAGSDIIKDDVVDVNTIKSSFREGLIVDYSELEEIKRMVYKDINSDLTQKLENMKKQYMIQNPEYDSRGTFTQVGIHDTEKDQDIEAIIHITDDGNVDLMFMCIDDKEIKYHKEKNGDFEYSEEKNGKVIEIASKDGLYSINSRSYANLDQKLVVKADELKAKFATPSEALEFAESSIPNESRENYEALRKKLGVSKIKEVNPDKIERLAKEKGISIEKLQNQMENVCVLGTTETRIKDDMVKSTSLNYTYKEEALIQDGKPSQVWIKDLDSEGHVKLKLFELTKDGRYIDVSSYNEKNGVPQFDMYDLEEIESMIQEEYGLEKDPKMLQHFQKMARTKSFIPKQADLISRKVETDRQKGNKIGKENKKDSEKNIEVGKRVDDTDEIPI